MPEILRPTTPRGPLGIPRKTRLEFIDDVLTIYDVSGARHAFPTARVLMPYSQPGQQLSAGLAVCDDAGRLLTALDIPFDPYAVTGFAKVHGLNVRIREGDFTAATSQTQYAPDARPVEVLARWFLVEYAAFYLLMVVCAFAGWHIARSLGDLPGFGSTGTGMFGIGCGLLAAICVGPIVNFFVKPRR
ncbi:MAG: hypothetical protein HOQ05_01425 [Corynebacteriales bacterium]|nr:hypothetical protein [Mycobacteriales bacterium]